MMQPPGNPHLEFHTIAEQDLIPVSKFSKYDTHLVTSNENLIIYTTSKRGFVRVINQRTSGHFVLATQVQQTITDLKLIVNPLVSTNSFLLVGSRVSGIFTIWSVSNDVANTPAILVYEILQVPKDTFYDFSYSKTTTSLLFTSSDTVLDIEIKKFFAAPHKLKYGNGLKSRTDLAKTDTFASFSGLKYHLPVYSKKIEGFAVADNKSLIGWVEEADASHHRFAVCASESHSSQVEKGDSSAISLSLEKNIILEKVASEKLVLCYFSLPKAPISNEGTLDYFITGSRNELLVYPHQKNSKYIKIDLPDGFTIDNLMVERVEDISLAMVFCKKLQKVALVKFQRYGTSENLEDISFFIQIVDFPETFSILNCCIWRSVEEIEKFKGHHVIDAYVYHTKGLFIVPISLGPRPNYSEQIVAKNSPASPEVQGSSSSEEIETGPEFTGNLPLIPQLQLLTNSHVDEFVTRRNMTKVQEDAILDFLESSNLVTTICKKVKDELLSIMLDSRSVFRICEMKNNGSISARDALNLIDEAVEESVFANPQSAEDEQINSESFQSVAVANPNYKQQKTQGSDFVETSSSGVEETMSAEQSPYGGKISDETEKNGSSHILPALFDSLEEASSSEPKNTNSPHLSSSGFGNTTQPISSAPFGSVANSSFSSTFSNAAGYPRNAYETQRVSSGLGFEKLSQSIPAQSSPLSSNSQIPGTTLGHGKSYSQIWGVTNPSTSLETTGNIGNVPSQVGNSVQTAWSTSSPSQPQSLVSPSQYPQNSAISQLPGNISQLSLQPTPSQEHTNAYVRHTHHQSTHSIGYPSQLGGLQPQTSFSQHPNVRMPSVSNIFGTNDSQNGNFDMQPNQQQTQLPVPRNELDTSSAELQKGSQYPFLTVQTPPNYELSEFERRVVKLLLLQGPMNAFGTIRTGPPAAELNSISQKHTDLGDILSSYTFIVLTAPPGLEEQGLSDAADSYINGTTDASLLLSSGGQSKMAVSRQEVQDVLRKLFGNDTNFLLLLGYVVYLISPSLNAQESLQVRDDKVSAGPGQRLKWAIALLEYVYALITTDPSSPSDTSPAALEQPRFAKEKWANNKGLFGTTLERIRKDAKDLGDTLFKYTLDAGQKTLLASRLNELFETLTKLSEN